MTIKITLYCPDCQSAKITKNGNNIVQKANFLRKNCERQFFGNHALCYKGCHSELNERILQMLVRGVGIRDVAEIEKISINKVLFWFVSTIKLNSNKAITTN
ncbi:MAG: hypothetical protein FWD66_04585 [Paludibacter sp.]|nr:hypothetical protein [Paludibacter sp.]